MSPTTNLLMVVVEVVGWDWSPGLHFANLCLCLCLEYQLQCFMVTARGFGSAVSACVRAQSCPVLCDPMDCSPPGSSVHGIF